MMVITRAITAFRNGNAEIVGNGKADANARAIIPITIICFRSLRRPLSGLMHERLPHCKSGKANNPNSFPANEETESAAAPSETRNLNESILKKRQSNKPRREKNSNNKILFSKITFHNKPTKNLRRTKIRSSNPPCVLIDIVTHGKLCLVQRLPLCKSGKSNTPFFLFHSFPAYEENGSAAALSETRIHN
ncbi:hypothetical protein CEXT_809691 [Caerostris extrusa]|uniref:Uncharacterized protein n=1 Tax=Caerostris extrusa TaxID=172846 RepID=A0AAV4MCB8_CAEEX|nr:hypothetical protein CEXT_809691 [Caerostris extrusa]